MKISSFAPILLLLKSAEAAFEWAGTFAVSDAMHQWSMQKVGGAYADATMRMVLYSTDAPNLLNGILAIETNEATVAELIVGECLVVEAGETISPITTAGSCFELHVDESANDSLFMMVTEGLTGIIIFAQHFPTEFERDEHYLKDSAGTDIEPVAQEGGAGDDHDHGHVDDHDEDKPSCACVAEEYNFNIDCTATAAMLDSLGFLKQSGCATDCSSDGCMEAWYEVQTRKYRCC
jgi:hypothetical protein